MVIGVPKEIKDHESRVGIVPSGVRMLTSAGHRVIVQSGAGALSAMPDADYVEAGAEIAGSAAEVWNASGMVVKVKEPLEREVSYFREGLILFTYLHLAPLSDLTDSLLRKAVTGIAYETIRDPNGTLPLLTPMSEVAGRMSRWERRISKRSAAAGGYCWAAFPAFLPRRLRSLGAVSWGSTRQKLRWEWAQS
jgi:alanine dehydrogenase